MIDWVTMCWHEELGFRKFCNLAQEQSYLVVYLITVHSSVDMFLALDKDMNGTLSKQELQEYADGTLTEIFIERGRSFY